MVKPFVHKRQGGDAQMRQERGVWSFQLAEGTAHSRAAVCMVCIYSFTGYNSHLSSGCSQTSFLQRVASGVRTATDQQQMQSQLRGEINLLLQEWIDARILWNPPLYQRTLHYECGSLLGLGLCLNNDLVLSFLFQTYFVSWWKTNVGRTSAVSCSSTLQERHSSYSCC